MADFSTILQSPQVRAIVQDNLLERAFHDALFPRLLFRGDAEPVEWPANVGDTMVFSGVGLIPPKMQPLQPGQDPVPSNYQVEQWVAQLQQYADTIDTPMPTSIVAIANLFLRNAQQLGVSAGQSLNRLVRDKMYDAALSGNTVADGAQSGVTTLRVARLNGFTTARNPNLAGASTVRFDGVSTANPLAVNINGTGGVVARNVTGFVADTPGDTIGPGVLTIDSSVTVADRAYVISVDSSYIVNAGGAATIDGIGPSNQFRLSLIRQAIARFRQQNVPDHPDGMFHMHLDPTSESELYNDPELQRLMTALPDYFVYRQFAIGQMLGTAFFRNTECPLPETVVGGNASYISPALSFSQQDPFPGELVNANGTVIHRPLLSGQGGIKEYYQDLNQLLTEAGITGRVGEFQISNNGIEVSVERIQLILRSPLNRLQDMVAASWKFIGDWPLRTDASTGDKARYKRFVSVQHA